MAKALKEFEWSNRSRLSGENAMDQYLDGKIWELTMDDAKELGTKNYNNPQTYLTIDSLRTALYNRAARLNKKFRYRKLNEDTIVVQAFEQDEE